MSESSGMPILGTLLSLRGAERKTGSPNESKQFNEQSPNGPREENLWWSNRSNVQMDMKLVYVSIR